MTADDFVAIVRKGPDKLRVDDLLLDTGEKQYQGKGLLRIEEKAFYVDMVYPSSDAGPSSKSGIFTKRDFWQLSGLIEDHLRFKCEHIGPSFGQCLSNEITKSTFRLSTFQLIPSGLDAMSSAERLELFARIQRQADGGTSVAQLPLREPTEDGIPSPVVVSFHARLADYPLLLTDTGTKVVETNPFLDERISWKSDTFIGEIDGFDYALIKDGKTADMHVHMKSKEGFSSESEQVDWKKFHSLMKALAFVHGVHAWPYRTEYWRAGRKLADKVTVACRLPRTSHAPFSERIPYDARLNGKEWNLGELIKQTAAFFERDSTLSEEVAELLYLFREADDGVHGEITTLTLCTLFENLVRLLFKELNLEQAFRKADKNLELFEQAKDEVSQYVSNQIAEKGAGYVRLQKVVSSAASFSPREMFQALVAHFGLPWDNDMELAFATWKRARHPLVHSRERASLTEDEQKESMQNESRIAGTINILLLKLVGYSGLVRTSAFEDKYRSI